MDQLFSSAGDWAVLFSVFLLIVPNWGSIKTFGDSGFLSQRRYEDIEKASSYILKMPYVLIGLQIVRNLALWITFTIYLLTSPTPNPPPADGEEQTAFFTTIYIVNASLIFAGTVFHVLSEITLYHVGWFGTSFLFRVVEALTFTAALVTVIIELVCLPEDTQCGEEIALLIVLIVVFIHEIAILLPRSYMFWSNQDAGGRAIDDMDQQLVPSQSRYPQEFGGVHKRAAANYVNNTQAQWNK
jgi:hypothetical protein